jgi:hypothetical protein
MLWTLQDRRWHPVDDGVLPYLLALMRSLWVWPLLHLWSDFLTPGAADLLRWPAVFGLLAGSTAVAQIAAFRLKPARRDRMAELRSRALFAVTGLAAVALVLYAGTGRPPPWRPDWLNAVAGDPLRSIQTTLIAAALWVWGLLAGQGKLHYEIYARNFAAGAAGLGLAALLSRATGDAAPGVVLSCTLAFFAVGLSTLALAGLRTAQHYERGRDEPPSGVSGHWMATIGGAVVVLLGLGLLVTQILTPDGIRRALGVVTPLLEAAGDLVYYVLLVVAWALFTLLDAIRRLIPAPEGKEVEPLGLPDPPNFAEQFQAVEQTATGLPPGIALFLRIAAVLLVAGALMLAFALVFRRFKTSVEEDAPEVRESIISVELLRAQLRQLFERARPAPAPPPFAAVTGDDPSAQIRRTYQAMLAWAAGQGLARAPGATPREHLEAVSRARPEHGAALGVITAAYLRARYGAEPVAPSLAQQVAEAWEGVARGDGGAGETAWG